MTRRDLLKLLLASPIAATVDVEALIWTPKPIIVVPSTFRGCEFDYVMYDELIYMHPAQLAAYEKLMQDILFFEGPRWSKGSHYDKT